MLETSGKKKEQLIKTLDSTDIQTDSARKIMGIDEMKISKWRFMNHRRKGGQKKTEV